MKVRINFTIDINPQAWSALFGTEHDKAPTPGDVSHYVEREIRTHLDNRDLLA